MVIPFRNRRGEGGPRVQNLLRVAQALNFQTRTDFTLAIVEQDSEPCNRALLEDLADVYVFDPYGGPFSRARAINAGARLAEKNIGILDSDLLPGFDFVEHGLEYLAMTGVVLPFTYVHYLTETTSGGIQADAAAQYPDLLRNPALWPPSIKVSHESVGGALWIARDIFDAVGGYDEHFVGWGVEDNDFFNRLVQVAQVVRLNKHMFHLWHPVPERHGGCQERNRHRFKQRFPEGAVKMGPHIIPVDVTHNRGTQ